MNQLNNHLLTVALREATKVPELTQSPAATKTYTSYLAALGPDIRLRGLLPALAGYSDEKGDAKQKKPPLLRYLQNVMVEVEKPPVEKQEEIKLKADELPAHVVGMVDLSQFDKFGKGKNKPALKGPNKLRNGSIDKPAALFYYAANLTGDDLANFQYRLEAAIVAGKMALRTFAHQDYKNNRNDG